MKKCASNVSGQKSEADVLMCSAGRFFLHQKLKIQLNHVLVASPDLMREGNMIKLACNQPRKRRGLLQCFLNPPPSFGYHLSKSSHPKTHINRS